MEHVELLAPAGNLSKAKTAILYGANAVYIGGQSFSLRSRASNFSLDQIAELCTFAHEHHSKVHVTVNIIPHPDDLQGLDDYLRALNDAGIDAIISASPTIITHALHMDGRQFEVHISTQRSILNSAAVRFWKRQGVERVVLGRETNLDSIEAICAQDIMPIEVFIHGGMCISYSGRCVLSNHMTDRDANRGGCAQSCRWKYELFDEQNEKISRDETPYSMSSRDLQAAKYIERLIHAGVASLKIEGRMKSDYYLAVVVGAYRRLIDAIESGQTITQEFLAEISAELARAENRPAGPGFYNGLPDQNVQLYRRHDESVTQEYIGYVLEEPRDGWMNIQVKNHFEAGTPVELFGPGIAPYPQTIEEIQTLDGLPKSVCSHPMEIVRIRWNQPARPGSMIRKQRLSMPDKPETEAKDGSCGKPNPLRG